MEPDTVKSYLDVKSWRVATPDELRCYHENVLARVGERGRTRGPSLLGVRRSLSPVDAYCYLKARFGEPNGFQTFLRKNSSDNWVHWDFNLKAADEDVYICGTSREIHFALSAKLDDKDWCELISAIKQDFARVGKEKAAVLNALEKWVVFPNKYVEIARICDDLHSEIVNTTASPQVYKTPSADKGIEETEQLLQDLTKMNRCSLELSLLTPILAEAYINMLVLMLCKREIKNNPRQFDEFVRSNIDVKLFDLPYKCEGFARALDQHSETFKNFKRVMDKRNHNIHGNCDPEREQIETVYFQGTRPLFKDPGDHIGRFLEAQQRQYQPERVVKEYEDVRAFLGEVVNCLDPRVVEPFKRIMEDNYPGYDVGRKKMGALFPNYVFIARLQGMKYDDELSLD